MGVNPTSIAELHFPEVIIDTALFSSRTSSFFKLFLARSVERLLLLLQLFFNFLKFDHDSKNRELPLHRIIGRSSHKDHILKFIAF